MNATWLDKITFSVRKQVSKGYIKTISSFLISFDKSHHGNNFAFQKGIAPTTKEVMAFFQEEKVKVMEWLACSLNLNPLENVWGSDKAGVYCYGDDK